MAVLPTWIPWWASAVYLLISVVGIDVVATESRTSLVAGVPSDNELSMKGVREEESRRTLAICLFGRVGNLRRSSSIFSSDSAASRLAYKSQRRHLIEANERLGWSVHVFLQTPDVEMRHELESMYHPTGALYQEDPFFRARFSHSDNHIWHEEKLRAFGGSVASVVGLMREAESERNVSYDAVFVLRFDLVFYQDLIVPDYDVLPLGLWVGSWCEVRDTHSRLYGNRLHGMKCGRLHAHALSASGVPDYLFVGTSENIFAFAQWGPKLDETFENLVAEHGYSGAHYMLNGGGHTMIMAHLTVIGLPVKYLSVVEQVDYTVARRSFCALELDWTAPRENVGLACGYVQLNGYCADEVLDSMAITVCPLEGLRVCAGPSTLPEKNCSLFRY